MLLASFAGVRNVRTLCFTSSVLPSYRLGCASAWLTDVFVLLFMAEGECTSVFSVVLLVYAGVIMLARWQMTTPLLIWQLDRKPHELLICSIGSICAGV